ncbi:5853_t:CDS:2 [Paraglomus occultum]|uniref:5853_t:CDS:1 n=1 Tax=Paraglomus occultum TaxID=144539 RepID=A0A9N8Z046_9GLOM|nr:5853_t:CDS:2 [Paraglomus occultum]
MYIGQPLLHAFSRGLSIHTRCNRIILFARQNNRSLSYLKYRRPPTWRPLLPRIAFITLPLSFCRHNFTLALTEFDIPKNTIRLSPINQSSVHARSETPRLLSAIVSFLSDYVIEPILVGWRFSYLTLLFLPVILTTPALFIGERVEKHGNERSGALWWYDLLVRQMETAGPTFIKLAQWAASRTDIFPEEMCARLSKLHSSVKPHSLSVTKQIISDNFNLPFEDIFTCFDPNPIGVGAIAQVYKATLKPELMHISTVNSLDSYPEYISAEIAVKILHPNVDKQIKRDLKILLIFAKILDAIPTIHWLSLPEEVMKFGEMMQDQLDLRIEGNNLVRFRENFKYRKLIKFPQPLMEYTTEAMLIEDYEGALPIRLFLRNGGGVFDRMLADIGLDAFLHMLIIDNFVHADLHPGNIMIKFTKPTIYTLLQDIWAKFTSTTPFDETCFTTTTRLRQYADDRDMWIQELNRLYNDGYRPQIVFVDTGLVSELNEVNRRNFLDLFRAVAEFDGYRAGKLMIERSNAPDTVIDGDVFALKMQHLILNVKSSTFQLAKIRISDVLTEVMQMVRTHHVKLDGDFVNIVIAILLLEGIGKQLDPEMDLLKSALPILRELGTQGAGRGVREGIKEIPSGGGWWLKFWFWLEARHWIWNASWEEYKIVFERHIGWPDM